MYAVFCGSEETMTKIAESGAKALNPKTMKWQIIDRKAQYTVQKYSNLLYELMSDIDLRSVAKNKGLII